MDIRMAIQSTPNPNALKFILSVPVRNQGNVTFRRETAELSPLAKNVFNISPHIVEVYFFDNYITVTQDGSEEWDALEEQIQKAILGNIAQHDPNFQLPQEHKPVKTESDNPEIAKITSILDQTIRPALQMDGGDLQVVNLDGNTLYINYQGACGSCPSSAMGTLKAIEHLLREEYNPEIIVELA